MTSAAIGAVGLDAVDEHAVHQADLRRGEPDPERVVHQLAHAADLLAQRVVEAVDGERAAAQHGVAVLADEPQRGVAAGARLGVERGVLLLGDLGGLFGVVLVHRRRILMSGPDANVCSCAAMSGPRARRLCPDAVFVPPRFDAYVAASRALFRVFLRTAPLVEGVSLEEAFLDVRGLERIAGVAGVDRGAAAARGPR